MDQWVAKTNGDSTEHEPSKNKLAFVPIFLSFEYL